MPKSNLKLIEATHPLSPLFPTLTPTEIDKLISAVKSGEMPPLVGRLSESQKGMIAAHLVTYIGRGGRGNKTPPGETNLTTAASLLNIHTDTVQMARKVLAEGTPDEIAKVYAGTMPVAVGRDILNGLTPEQRRAKRPHDGLRVSTTRRPSVFAKRVLEMMAADEVERARKAEQNRLRREKAKAKLTSPAAAPLPIVEMAQLLVKAAQHVPVDDAYSALSPHISHAQLTTLIEWLIDIAYKEPRKKEPTP